MIRKPHNICKNNLPALHTEKIKEECRASQPGGWRKRFSLCLATRSLQLEASSWPNFVWSIGAASSPRGMYRSSQRYRSTLIHPSRVFTGYSGSTSLPCRDARRINPTNNCAELTGCDTESSRGRNCSWNPELRFKLLPALSFLLFLGDHSEKQSTTVFALNSWRTGQHQPLPMLISDKS